MKTVILAGGSGQRLWPLSRKSYPKQFLKFDGGESFLQKTVRRSLEAVKPEDLFVITGTDFYHDVLAQLKELDPEIEKNVILEPNKRNTAPAIALAVEYLRDQRGMDLDEVLFVTPADHLVSPTSLWVEALQKAEARAKQGGIVTFGIRPSRPETGYGYIKAKEASGEVEEFVEKPSLQRAKEYLLEGDYFWNSGMFAFTLRSFLDELSHHCPEIASHTGEGLAPFLRDFSNMPDLSIDYALMEKSKQVSMLPLDLSWSDVGCWDNVYEMLDKDENQNAKKGSVVAVDTKNSLLISSKRLVATIGVEDLLVVESDDVILIAAKEESQRVREVVGELKKWGRREVDEHLTIHRPWGSYTVLEEGTRYKMKHITVNPEAKLSLQMHYHRSEHWVIVRGTAEVTIGEEVSKVHEGESIFVPKSALHRVSNPGKVPLEIIEVQVGEYLGEDDIVRFEDVYGRLKEEALV